MREFVITDYFKKQLRPYQKKYRQILSDIIFALENFDERQTVSLGANVYKLRLRVTGLARGKSGSFRMLVLVVMPEDRLVPVTLYSKNDRATITYGEIAEHLEAVQNELT